MSTKPDQPEDGTPELTLLLRKMQQGDHEAGEKAVGLVYQELHRIAARELRRETPGHTLVPTALINEAYLRLAGHGDAVIQNRGHFLAIASQQMRHILVDHARAKKAQRRGGGAIQVGLEQANSSAARPDLDILELDDALKHLEQDYPRAAKVVELRYFGGNTDEESADALGVSLNTIQRDWRFARCWLFDRMQSRGETVGKGA